MAAASGDDEEGYSLKEEIEMLEAIYIHELTIKGRKERPSSISLLLHPSTGDEDHKQYVCLTLEIILTNKYPNELPSIKIRNPRGLSEAHIKSISDNLYGLTESLLGSPMLYQIIDYAKESLTDNNIPSCTCAICLDHFQDHDCFTKTDCYHYFHCHCLLRYIDYHLNNCEETNSCDDSSTQIICPMCREPITYDLDALQSAPDVDNDEQKIVYHADAEMKRLQQEMSKLYNKQLQKGGIINVEEEKNKSVISLTMESSSPSTSSSIEKPVVDETLNSTSNDSSTSNTGVVDSKTNEREGKSRVERPSSSRKNRGRGGYRPWSEGRRSDRRDDRWSCPTKSFEKKKDLNKHSRGGTSRVSTAGHNRKDDNKPLGSEELSEKNLENEPQRLNENAGLPLEKGVQTRPWKGALTSSTIDNTKMRDTNSISRKNEVENNTSTYRELTKKADNNKRKISSKDKDVQYKPVPESSSLGVNTSRDPPDCTPPESISKNQSKVVEPSPKNKTRQKRDNYKSYSKSEGKEVDKRKYPKSSSSDKKPEQSKARPDSGVVAPPPGFETFVNKSGGRRPPPGFENNDSSIPKPPGF